MRKISVTAVLACLVGVMPVSASAQPEFTLKIHHLLPPVAIAHHAMMVPWAEKIERESGGRIKFEIYPSMHLGGQPPMLIDQVREGVVDVVWTLPGYTPGRFPRIEVFELPFLNANPIVSNYAIAEFVERHPEEFAQYHVVSLFVHAGQVIHSTVPVRTVDDLQGLKIRIPTRIAGWMIERWGAIPVGSPLQKVPEMLSKGIVDATLIPFEASYGLQVHDLVDYNIFLDDPRSERFNGQVLIIAMNRGTYEAMPADLRAVIDANSGRNIAQWIGRVWMDAEKPGREAALNSGEFIFLPPTEVERLREKTAEAVAEQWINVVARKGIDGRPLINEARGLIEKYEREFGRDGAGAEERTQ